MRQLSAPKPKFGPHDLLSEHTTLPMDGLAYRLVVGIGGGVVLVVAAVFLVRVLPLQERTRTYTRRATVGHGLLACISAFLGIVAAGCNFLASEPLNAALSTCVAGTQLLDGLLTWRRYCLLHPQYKASTLTTTLVHAFIVLFLFLPYVLPWAFYALDGGSHGVQTINVTDLDPRSFGLLVLTVDYLLSLPSRLVWEIRYVRHSSGFENICEWARSKRRPAVLPPP